MWFAPFRCSFWTQMITCEAKYKKSATKIIFFEIEMMLSVQRSSISIPTLADCCKNVEQSSRSVEDPRLHEPVLLAYGLWNTFQFIQSYARLALYEYH